MVRNNIYINSVITKFIYVLFLFLNTILINRFLGPTLKGQYSYIMNIVNILVLVISFSIAQSYPYFLKKYGETMKQKISNLIYYQLLLYLILSVILIAVFRDTNISYILVISTLAQFNNQVTFLSIIENISKKNRASIISIISYTVLLVVVFIFFDSNLMLTLIAYTGFILLNSISLVNINKIYPDNSFFDYKLLVEILRFSFFPMVTSLLITFNYNIDIIILKQYVPYSSIGVYSLGVTLAGMLWIIPDAFKEVLFNKTARNDSILQILFGIKFNVIISIIIIVGFTFLGEFFIKFVYGIDFINSYFVSLILFIGTIPMIFFKMINTLYISNGNTKISFYVLFVSVVLNVILNYIFIPNYGIGAAAAASVASYSVCGIAILLSFTRMYKVSIKDVFLPNKDEITMIKRLLIK